MPHSPSIEKFPKKWFSLLGTILVSSAMAAPQNPVGSAPAASLSTDGAQEKTPSYRTVRPVRTVSLDFSRLQNAADADRKAAVLFTLPLPEGGETEFTLTDSEIFPPELAQRYPHIRSLKGHDRQGREVRLDMSEEGARAIVFDRDGNWLVQRAADAVGPSASGINEYLSFRETAAPAWTGSSNHRLKQRASLNKTTLSMTGFIEADGKPPINDNDHRDYRIAVATTSAYSRYFGGSVSKSLATIAEVLNRVNAIYERDLGIHLTLVKDNDKIIFLDPASDPFIGPGPESPDWDIDFTKKQSQKIVTQIIGKDNFDVGHVFELSVGGSSDNNGVCQDQIKANASSGLSIRKSTGNAKLNQEFLNTVAHEIGHQFGADHTMNGCERNEGAEARNAYEPGSGSTIMSYAGECPIWNGHEAVNNPLHSLQDIKGEYFHAKNIEQIRTFLKEGGATCGIKRSNPNRPPEIVIQNGEASMFIPAKTPFSLTGFARSQQARAQLTYTWEQIDLGPEQLKNEVLSDKGKGPIFRSYPPGISGTRIFPKLEAILGEEKLSIGEVYPATTRELNFRLTVRDNLGALSSTAYADRKIRVVDTGQAFTVTYPAGGEKWRARDRQSLSWNSAGTAQAPVSCQRVRIDLSIDGGHSYLFPPLLVSVPNTGRAQVDVPPLGRDISRARIRVGCETNVFFAMSPGNFSIVK